MIFSSVFASIHPVFVYTYTILGIVEVLKSANYRLVNWINLLVSDYLSILFLMITLLI